VRLPWFQAHDDGDPQPFQQAELRRVRSAAALCWCRRRGRCCRRRYAVAVAVMAAAASAAAVVVVVIVAEASRRRLSATVVRPLRPPHADLVARCSSLPRSPIFPHPVVVGAVIVAATAAVAVVAVVVIVGVTAIVVVVVVVGVLAKCAQLPRVQGRLAGGRRVAVSEHRLRGHAPPHDRGPAAEGAFLSPVSKLVVTWQDT
jgi:hypothetical protein